MDVKYIPLFCECDGEFGDGDGTEEGYENCLWDSGYEDENEESEED